MGGEQVRPDPGLPLEALVRRVRDARQEVDHCRHGRIVRHELENARHELMVALQDYTAALERRDLPIPWRLRAELKLHRDLFGG
jgi:hypothetical protein